MNALVATVKVCGEDRNEGGELERAFQVDLPSARTTVWVPSVLWDKLTKDKQEMLTGLLSGTLDSALHGWINDWVDSVRVVVEKLEQGEDDGSRG